MDAYSVREVVIFHHSSPHRVPLAMTGGQAAVKLSRRGYGRKRIAKASDALGATNHLSEA